MQDFKIRPAEPHDYVKVVDLVNSAYRGDSSRAGWTTEADLLGGQRTDLKTLSETMREPGSLLLLAFDGQNLVGCVYLKNKKKSAYLGMLAVDPRRQGAGIGDRLLKRAEEYVKSNWGSKAIQMTVIQKRTELINWYNRRGYRTTEAREPFPYGDSRFGEPKISDLEFVVLEKKLS